MITFKEFIEQWNALHVKHCKSDDRNAIMAVYLETMMLNAKTAYYHTGEAIMDDQTFDKMEDWLRMIKPESEILKKVGA